ncbi:MAG: EAL domain-containing protein [Gammaproteobacteria bacterium]|nr:EAL domain-containing protein [Gammaproteobacteria bacterium]
MFISTIVVGGVVWYVSDILQTEKFSTIFRAQLVGRFARQAEDERTAFDQYIKAHHQAVKLISNSSRLQNFVNSNEEFLDNNEDIKFHTRPPEWLPKMSSLRSMVQPRYILLFNKEKELREIYTGYDKIPSEEILRPSEILLQLSYHQSYLTMIGDKPFLITSEFIGGSGDNNSNRKAILMMAAPIDNSFLIASQGVRGDVSIIALLTEDRQQILESSQHDLIPVGESLEVLRDRYLLNGQGFFDYGSSFALEFVSFVSPDEVQQLTDGILNQERQSRTVTALAYIASFSLIVFWITGRIRRLTQKVTDFSEHMDILQPDSEYNSGDQIDILESRFQHLAIAIKKETEALEHQALHDSLTELPNRKYLNNRMQLEILKGEVEEKGFVFILGDLNRFKEINDTLGHHIGDMVLQQASERLFYTFRKSDVVARLGGDEFGILLPDTNIGEAVVILNKLYDAFEIPFVVEKHYLSLGISLGISEYPAHGDDVNMLLKCADIAMYSAKNNKVLYTVYDHASDPHSEGKLTLTTALREAIASKALEVYYQPKIDIKTDEVVSAEALIRWNHPERGFIPPDDFIPLAEQTGLVKPLTEMVLDKSLALIAEWRNKGIHISMAINISPHCLHDWNLTDIIRGMIRKYNIAPGECVLELTESAIMTNPMGAKEILREIDMMGVVLSIDDFGTGYSSLAYLKELPLQELKVDRTFIMEMTKNESDAAIVEATITMAHTLGMRVVAEGVEDKETWRLLKDLGCDIGQGYYKGRPMPVDEFFDYMCNNSEVKAAKVGI